MSEIIKKCSNCNATYTDNDLNFCFTDGTRLIDVEDSESKTLELTERITNQFTKSGIEVVQRKIRKNIDDSNWSVEYPQIQGLKSQYIQTRINNYLRRQFTKELTEEIDRIKNSYLDDEENFSNPVTIEITYQICLLNENIASIQRFFYQEAERAAHPNHYWYAYNIDLSLGYEFTYYDLFKLDSDYNTRIPELISVSLEGEIVSDWEERDEFEFSIYKDHLEIINLFDNHVSRAIMAEIQINDIKDIIHPEGPLGSLVSLNLTTSK